MYARGVMPTNNLSCKFPHRSRKDFILNSLQSEPDWKVLPSNQQTNAKKPMKTFKGREEEMGMITGSNSFHGVGNALDLSAVNNNPGLSDMTESQPGTSEHQDEPDDFNSNDSERDETDHASQESEDELQFADMNVNTNGKTSTWQIGKAPGHQDLLELDDQTITKISRINMGEMPLEPVGVSMSGSGMQLFVKLNTDVKKALASTVSVKPTKTGRKNKNLKRTTRCQKKNDNEPLDLSKRHAESVGQDVFSQEQAGGFGSQLSNENNSTKHTSFKRIHLPAMVSLKPEKQIVTAQPTVRNEYPQRFRNVTDVTDPGRARHLREQPTMLGHSTFRRHSPEHRGRMRKRNRWQCSHPPGYPSHSRRYSPSPSPSPPSHVSSRSSVEDGTEVLDGYECDSSSVRAFQQPRKKRRLQIQYDNGKLPDKRDFSSKLKQSQQSHSGSSVGPSFDTTQISPRTMDFETLNKFTQYTQDMRTDLKRRYKDLNNLLRDFNLKLREKNGANDPELSNKDSRELEKRCVVM